jgi:cytochrome c oxidase subunit 1
MSEATIVSLPDQSTARIPKMNFLTKENGLLSWLLTGDHKRIATLYLISITFFFFIGGAWLDSFAWSCSPRRPA